MKTDTIIKIVMAVVITVLLTVIIYLTVTKKVRCEMPSQTTVPIKAFEQTTTSNKRRFSELSRSLQAPTASIIGEVPKTQKITAKNINQSGGARLIRLSSLPENFDWRNVFEKHLVYPTLDMGNYCSAVQNQHSPVYCGSCFIFAAVQALEDRFYIMNTLTDIKRSSADGTNRTSSEKLDLSKQQLLNCLPDMTCFTGGDSFMVYDYIYRRGIVPGSCNPYESRAYPDRCSPECYTCLAQGQTSCTEIGEPENAVLPFGENKKQKCCKCCSVSKYPKYGIEGFSNIVARFKNEIKKNTNGWKSSELINYIKTEIYTNGPVPTGLDAIPIETYKSGIFVQRPSAKYKPEINHAVCIVGWGNDGTTDYWIIRNSWGSFWGENGYIRVDMHSIGLDDYNNNDVFGAYPTGWVKVSGLDPTDVGVL